MLSGTTRRAQRRGSRVHDDGKRGRQEPRLERRVTPGFTVELHRPGWALQHLDAHGAAAAEPQAPRAVRRPPHELEERSEEHTSELQSQSNLVCRLLLEKKKKKRTRS